MLRPPDWIPMRWPAEWRGVEFLRLIEGTPVNCLLATDPAGGFARVAEEARRRGLAVVGPDDAMVAGRGRLDLWRLSSSPVIAFTDNVWPSIKLSAKGEQDAVDAGPTGVPWIDSNGWFVQFARTVAPERTVWIVADPPERTVLSADSYQCAIADSAACGGRWVVSLDSRLREELAAGKLAALATWRSITRTLAFFETHKNWRTWQPMGVLGVLSDFAGPNEFLSMEALNLLSRRQLPVRIFDKSRVGAWAWDGVKSILYADREPPAPDLRQKLLAFVRSGGLLICPPACSMLIPGSPGVENHPRFHVYRMERGRAAIAKTDFDDPYVLAADAHVLLGRRHDVIRTWNAGSIVLHCTAAPRGGRAIIQLVSYTHRPTEFVTVGAAGRWRSARFFSLGSDNPALLKPAAAGGMTEFHLPSLSVYGALELEAA